MVTSDAGTICVFEFVVQQGKIAMLKILDEIYQKTGCRRVSVNQYLVAE